MHFQKQKVKLPPRSANDVGWAHTYIQVGPQLSGIMHSRQRYNYNARAGDNNDGRQNVVSCCNVTSHAQSVDLVCGT